ncbi:unnamed protein product, partial [Allacma fusca]
KNVYCPSIFDFHKASGVLGYFVNFGKWARTMRRTSLVARLILKPSNPQEF